MYVRSAPDKLSTLAALRNAAEQKTWDEESTDALIAFSHRLAGSGGSYGFTRLGDAARALEGFLKEGITLPGDAGNLQQYLANLELELRSLAATPLD